MPHLAGSDLTQGAHPRVITLSERGSFRVHACRNIGRGQEVANWPPHSATQTDAEVAIARINSPEVMELRRTVSLDVRAADELLMLAETVCKFGQKVN